MAASAEAWDPEVFGRARHVIGERRGYSIKAIVAPHIVERSTPEALWSFRRWATWGDVADAEWFLDRHGKFRWTTRKRKSLEDRIQRASRRERGLRGSITSIAARLGSSASSVKRAIQALAATGRVLVTGGGRGRYATTKIVASSIHQPIGIKAGELSLSVRSALDWARFSQEEQDELRADAQRWRDGLAASLARAGFGSTEEYMAFVS